MILLKYKLSRPEKYRQKPLVFLERDYKTFLMQPLIYTLTNFWPKMNNEPNWYIC